MKFFAKIALPVLATALLMPTAAMANGKLPFVGKRYFNFYGGSGTGEIITINKNGNVTIVSDVTAGSIFYGSAVVYRGKYKTLMPDGYGRYYRIKGNKIYLTDAKGQTLDGDSGDGCSGLNYGDDGDDFCVSWLRRE